MKVPRGPIPLYWRDEQTGVMKAAVEAYLDHKANDEQLALVIDYCASWVEAPVWSGGKELKKLRASIKAVKTNEDLREWIWKALDVGIDPL